MKLAALALALVIAMPLAHAEDPADARAFVDRIYKQYLGKNAHGVMLDKSAQIERYFARPIANKIEHDRAVAKKHGDAPNLDSDPFVDAQDWEIAKYDVALAVVSPVAQTATITFTSFDRATTIVLDLVAARPGWRISEIHYAGTNTLSKIVAGKAD